MTHKIIIKAAAMLAITALLSGIFIHGYNTGKRVKWQAPPQISVFIPENSTILMVSVDEFLTGCIRGMILPNDSPSPEALAAIAAALKTQILFRLQNNSQRDSNSLGADFAISESFPYTRDNGNTELNALLRTAVQNTVPLTVNGELFDCRVCRISTGLTEATEYSPSLPLLCDTDSKGYTSRLAFSTEEVWQIMKPYRAPSDCAKWFSDGVYKPTGTLDSIEFCSVPISGETVRKRFGLPSTAISVEYTNDSFYFNCKGIGDNQGLSVNAALFLAEKGYSAEEILSYFFPTAELGQYRIING